MQLLFYLFSVHLGRRRCPSSVCRRTFHIFEPLNGICRNLTGSNCNIIERCHQSECRWVWVYWCFTSHATIFQSYMWCHRCAGRLKKNLYLQLYSRAPNAIDISQGSLTCPSYTDTGPPFLYGDSDTPSHLVAFYDTLGIRRTYSRLKPPASSRGRVSSWLNRDESDKHKLNLCSAKRAAMSTILLHNRCVKNGICFCDIFLEFWRVRIQNHIIWLYVFVCVFQ